MRTVVTVAPTVEPITLLEAKAQLRIEAAFVTDDDYINSLISAARGRCESYCNQYFTAQTIAIDYDGFIPVVLELPYPNLTVTSIVYTDNDYNLQTVAPADYDVDSISNKVYFNSAIQSISFKVTCTTTVPIDISGVEHSIKLIITDLYDIRSESVVGVSLADNPAVKALLYPFRSALGI